MRIDSTGRIQEVLNQADLLAKWPTHRALLRQTYAQQAHAEDMLQWLDQAVREPDFLRTRITAHGIYDFLFPGLYRTYQALSLLTTSNFSSFFGNIGLPLTVQNTVQPATIFGSNTVLRMAGELDTDALREKEFRRFLQDTTDVYNVKTNLTAEFEATYQLDAYQWPVEAELFLLVRASGSAYRNTLARKFSSY